MLSLECDPVGRDLNAVVCTSHAELRWKDESVVMLDD
jgi:hypothetical protein